ncbi:MAG: hypothetical protein K2X93_21670 [Candidatus Obscuribacterales bacterium]|nr:hypothetical protein [Candidatus Obscuribacterales bacterium]
MSTKLQKSTLVLTTILMAIASLVPISRVLAAENLTLRKGVSFVDDKDSGFPIIADKMEDTTIDSGKPALLFFGASGDLNTNRQAKRLISVYNHFKAKNIKFIVIDVDHSPNAQATELIKKHYKGYIPCQVVIDSTGNSVWSKSGEAAEGEVSKEVEQVTK